jgi:uncharacterized protein YkwD
METPSMLERWTSRTLGFAVRAEKAGIALVAAGVLSFSSGVFLLATEAEGSPEFGPSLAGQPESTPTPGTSQGSAPPRSNLEPTATATLTATPTATEVPPSPTATLEPPTATPMPATPVPPRPTPVPQAILPPAPTPIPPTPIPPTPVPPPPPQSVSLHPVAQQMFALHNQARAAAGLPPLQINATLVAVADERAVDMATNNYFSHTSPSGETAFSLLEDYGFGYSAAGENIARNNYPESEAASVSFQGFMNSPGHRANILEDNYTHVGISYRVAADGMRYFAVVFAGF